MGAAMDAAPLGAEGGPSKTDNEERCFAAFEALVEGVRSTNGNDGASSRRDAYELVICGSPRKGGVSARYADELVASLREGGVRTERWDVASHSVGGCVGCEACRHAGHACVIRDDMGELYDLLDGATAVHVVAPVYFSGPTSQFKAVLDRLQPYWERRRGPNREPGAADAPKRPVTLHVIGSGGDPYGFAALESCVRSSFGAAGWRVEGVVNRIGWGQPQAESQKETFVS